DAKADGGQFITGGERMGDKGYFYAPTLVTGLPRHSRLVVEEQFGPIVPLLEFSDIDELIAHLNQSKFGLAGSVWSPDVAEATAIAARLETGTVWINQHLAMIPQAPVSGRKWSGGGVENGQLGFESYSELQTLSIAKS
ncbi:MAG: aldehyde dehydrogenase, partial [Spongiibacter sp.]|nr:aldehyde dehydrogenase [Spongiibacter sp.]